MKNIGRILLILFSVLAAVGFVWVLTSPNSASPELDFEEWMNKGVTSYMIYVSLVALLISVVAFAIYKVVDLLKHPSHLREALWVFGAIAIAVVIGLLGSSSDQVVYGNGEIYEGGFNSKMIGTGIISAIILFVVAVVFLLIDTVKGIIKG